MPDSSIPNNQQILAFEKTKNQSDNGDSFGENVTINHTGQLQGADHKETRMTMMPACKLDGEIYGRSIFWCGDWVGHQLVTPVLLPLLQYLSHCWQWLS